MCITTANPSAVKEITMIVWPHTVNKNSEDSTQVLRVKEGVGSPWKKLNGTIEGFTFVPGHAYMLMVKKERGTDSVTGKKSYHYTLVKTLQDKNLSTSLDNTEWKVESVGGYKIDLDSNITFSGGEMHAKICNIMSGKYSVNQDKLAFEGISTKMMCNSPSMPLETALGQSDTVYDIIGNKLHIRTSYGLEAVLTKVK